MEKSQKTGKKRKISIIVTVIAAVFALAVIITNFFIPVKYLTAYLAARNDKNPEGNFRITFIDVGYGDCTLIEFPDGKCALIDAGDGVTGHETNVLKTLNRRCIDKIDYLFCTSVRKERIGGLTDILNYKSVDKVFVPYCTQTQVNSECMAFYNKLNTMNSGIINIEDRTKAAYVEYGAGIFEKSENPEQSESDYIVCVLSPSAHDMPGGDYEKLNQNPTDENVWNASAVIYVEYQGVGILLCGDMSAERQRQLLNEHPEGAFQIQDDYVYIRNTQIMKVAHNGYKGADCVELYDFIQPESAVISVGDNGMNSPSSEAVSNAQKYVEDRLYRTDLNGNITITVANGNYSVLKEKK